MVGIERIGITRRFYCAPVKELDGGGGVKRAFSFNNIPSFKELNRSSLNNRTIFGRFDLNLKPKKGALDPKRLEAALPTIEEIVEAGGILFVASHRSEPADPKGVVDLASSMKPVAELIKQRLPGAAVHYIGDYVQFEPGQALSAATFARHIYDLRAKVELKPGSVVVLENLRYYPESVKDKEEVNAMARFIADNFDLYIDDAFGTAHRGHASMIVPSFKKEGSYVGPLMQQEMDALQPILVDPTPPFIGVLGGSKIAGKDGKIEVLKGLLPKVNGLIVGGAMGNTFLCAQLKLKRIGSFAPAEDDISAAAELRAQYGAKIILPKDLVFVKGIGTFEQLLAAELKAGDLSTTLVDGLNVPDDYFPADIGPLSVKTFNQQISQAMTIFANGPISVYEQNLTAQGMIAVVRQIDGRAAVQGVNALGGGGDFLKAAKDVGVSNMKLSTGGGALLQVVAKNGEVPAFTAFFQGGQ